MACIRRTYIQSEKKKKKVSTDDKCVRLRHVELSSETSFMMHMSKLELIEWSSREKSLAFFNSSLAAKQRVSRLTRRMFAAVTGTQSERHL